MATSFMYRPLRATHEIRLLEILSSNDNLHQYRLHNVRIDDPSQCPRYTAVSYAWGLCDKNCTIAIDDEKFYISQNLADALDHILELALNSGPYLWVDQVCINQFDQKERSSQVGYMNEIYGKAAAVCVWLGLPEDDTDHAMQTINTWSACIGPVDTASQEKLLPAIWEKSRKTEVWGLLTNTLSSQRTWAAIHNLASRTWWERTWVVQEATGPAPTYAMCGRFWTPFLDLLKALLVAHPITRFPGLPFLPLESRHFYPMFMTFELRYRGQLRLLDALHFCRSFKCENPRDKVYAVLASLKSSQITIRPDYSRSVLEVYRNVVRHCTNESPPLHRLDFLGYVTGSISLLDRHDWPSFIPDWTDSPSFDNFKKTQHEYQQGKRLYNASLEHIGKISLHNHKLYLDAFSLDEVSSVKETGTRDHSMADLLLSWGPHDPRAQYLPGVTYEEAFLHTIIGDVLRPGTFCLERGKRFDAESLSRNLTSLKDMQEAHHMRISMTCTVSQRRFFSTTKGYMGVGPAALDVGDKICGFLGGQMLYAVRSHSTRHSIPDGGPWEFRFLGECYVHGFMDGEALRYRSDGSVESFEAVLV